VTARDRTVVMVLGLAAMVAAFWFLLLSPKKDDVASLKDKVTAAQVRLETAQASTQAASAAKARYATDYKVVANLGKAVPADDDVASLVYQLQVASEASDIDFESIKLTGASSAATAPVATPAAQAGALATEQKNGTTSTGATTPTTPASTTTPAAVPATQTSFAGLPPGASVGTAGLPTMPFTFNFSGSFFNLEKLLRKVDAFTKLKGKRILVDGRLLTIDSIQLTGFPTVKATINVTAFLLPDDQGLTAGATAQGPAAGGATSATTTNTGTPTPPVAAATPVAGVGR
jgi:hypothetical protein